MSPPEVVLWNALRRRPGGFKFRRQHPAGRYRLDFYCDAARLCIEVDGQFHDAGDNPERDEERSAWLAMHGIETLRLPAQYVMHNLDSSVISIVAVAKARTTLSSP